ncbi:hypothetical protein D3C78_1862600 [compost metagenome]
MRLRSCTVFGPSMLTDRPKRWALSQSTISSVSRVALVVITKSTALPSSAKRASQYSTIASISGRLDSGSPPKNTTV